MAYKFKNVIIDKLGNYSDDFTSVAGKQTSLVFVHKNEHPTLAENGDWYKLESRKFRKALPTVYLHKKSPQCIKLNPTLEDSTLEHLDVIHLDLVRPCLDSKELLEAIDGLQKAAFVDGQRNMQGQFRSLLGIHD